MKFLNKTACLGNTSFASCFAKMNKIKAERKNG